MLGYGVFSQLRSGRKSQSACHLIATGGVEDSKNVDVRIVFDLGHQVGGDIQNAINPLDLVVDEPTEMCDIVTEGVHYDVPGARQTRYMSGLVQIGESRHHFVHPSGSDFEQQDRIDAKAGTVGVEPHIDMEQTGCTHAVDSIPCGARTNSDNSRDIAITNPTVIT